MATLTRMVPRMVVADDTSRLFTATHSILSIPAPLDLVHALAVMPGLGEDKRVVAAIQTWEATPSAQHLVISGTNKDEAVQPQLSLQRLQAAPFFLKRTDGLLTQVEALHTREQTDWIVEQAKGHDITSLALFVSHWHMPRAYLTLLKSMLNAGLKIPLFPATVGSSPTETNPELNETIENLSAGEASRIKKYQEIGQIASLAELTNYLDWLWAQKIVKI